MLILPLHSFLLLLPKHCKACHSRFSVLKVPELYYTCDLYFQPYRADDFFLSYLLKPIIFSHYSKIISNVHNGTEIKYMLGDLNKSAPHRLADLNVWLPGTIRRWPCWRICSLVRGSVSPGVSFWDFECSSQTQGLSFPAACLRRTMELSWPSCLERQASQVFSS